MLPLSLRCESLEKYLFREEKGSTSVTGKAADISGMVLSFLSSSRWGGITEDLSA
jgi:hypothetical protein